MNIYEIEEYKQALRTLMTERRSQFGSRFTFEKMAEACGIQKTYLSKVLNSSAHLNPDQLYSACDFLKLNITDTNFVLLLRESEIALNKKRAALLKSRIEELRVENLKTESAIVVQRESSFESHRFEYYTDIDLQLVHMFITVPTYAKDPSRICQKIGIDDSRLQSILLKLQSWKIVRFHNGVYQAEDPKQHLPEDSPVFLAFGILNRIKTIEKLRSTAQDKNADYFFSAMFSASTKFQGKLRRRFLELLKETQAEVIDSKSEEVFQLNIDFFRWS